MNKPFVIRLQPGISYHEGIYNSLLSIAPSANPATGNPTNYLIFLDIALKTFLREHPEGILGYHLKQTAHAPAPYPLPGEPGYTGGAVVEDEAARLAADAEYDRQVRDAEAKHQQESARLEAEWAAKQPGNGAGFINQSTN